MVNGRRPMSRVVLSWAPKRNSDVAIATITPLPQHLVNFSAIRSILADFINVEKHLSF
jgi:hypothetical protein